MSCASPFSTSVLHGEAAPPEIIRLAAHHDAGGVVDDHHIAVEALAVDALDDDAVAVVVHEAPGVRRRTLGRVGRGLFRGDGDERGVGLGVVAVAPAALHLRDLVLGKVPVREELKGAGLPHRQGEFPPCPGRRPVGEHEHHRVQADHQQQQSFEQDQEEAADAPSKPGLFAFAFCHGIPFALSARFLLSAFGGQYS